MTGGADVIKAAVLADTHGRSGTERTLSDAVWARLAEADVIVHAGDVAGLRPARRVT